MAANCCNTCDILWPRQHMKCPDCGGSVVFRPGESAIDKDEYDRRMRLLKARKGYAAPLAAFVQAECDREWALLEDIASKTRLSVADLIDGHPRKAA